MSLEASALKRENARLQELFDEAAVLLKDVYFLSGKATPVTEGVLKRIRTFLDAIDPPSPTEAAFTVWCEANGFPETNTGLRIFRGGADWVRAEQNWVRGRKDDE